MITQDPIPEVQHAAVTLLRHGAEWGDVKQAVVDALRDEAHWSTINETLDTIQKEAAA